MNVYQRIVLILGASALIYTMIYQRPAYDYYRNVSIIQANASLHHYAVRVSLCSVAEVGATFFLWWALSGIGKKKE